MSKQINIGGRLHSTEQGNVITGANEVLDDTKGKKQNVINADVDAELLRLYQSKQNNLTFDNTPTEESDNPVKSGGVYAADKALSNAIDAILTLIPSAATALNQLADKNFVNSSIATDTATFRGTSETGLSEAQFLEWANSLTHDMNDYVFWQTIDEVGNTLFKRYKWNGTQWLYEYTLNNSSFTADQWAAIMSGITSALVEKLNGLPTNTALQQALNSKQDALTFDNVPTEGSNNPVKSGGVYSAVKAEEDARLNLAQTVTGIGGDVSQIEDVIPAGATAQNQLVANASMEAYVASIINNITASFTLSTDDGHINLTLTQVNGRVATLTLSSSDIASAQALTALTGRVTTAEGNITSLTGRVSTNETDIANLQQLYNDLQQSKPVPVTALPETGQQQGVIYRLAGTTSYSDYMWNGSTWVLMATYNNAIDDEPTAGSDNLVKSGGIFSAITQITSMDSRLKTYVNDIRLYSNKKFTTLYVNYIIINSYVPSGYVGIGLYYKLNGESSFKDSFYYLPLSALHSGYNRMNHFSDNDDFVVSADFTSSVNTGDAVNINATLCSFNVDKINAYNDFVGFSNTNEALIENEIGKYLDDIILVPINSSIVNKNEKRISFTNFKYDVTNNVISVQFVWYGSDDDVYLETATVAFSDIKSGIVKCVLSGNVGYDVYFKFPQKIYASGRTVELTFDYQTNNFWFSPELAQTNKKGYTLIGNANLNALSNKYLKSIMVKNVNSVSKDLNFCIYIWNNVEGSLNKFTISVLVYENGTADSSYGELGISYDINSSFVNGKQTPLRWQSGIFVNAELYIDFNVGSPTDVTSVLGVAGMVDPMYVLFAEGESVVSVKSSGGDFTTLRAALEYANSKANRSNHIKILLGEGTYNMTEEYTETELKTRFRGYEIHEGVVLVGATKEKTIIKAELSDELAMAAPTNPYVQTITTVGECISTLNPVGKGYKRIENLTVIAKNCKYCVHDDWDNEDALHEYINCNFIKKAPSITPPQYSQFAMGGGTKNNTKIVSKDCSWIGQATGGFYFHNNDVAMIIPARIDIDGSTFVGTPDYAAIRITSLKNNSTALRNELYIRNSNFFSGKGLLLNDEDNTLKGWNWDAKGYGNVGGIQCDSATTYCEHYAVMSDCTCLKFTSDTISKGKPVQFIDNSTVGKWNNGTFTGVAISSSSDGMLYIQHSGIVHKSDMGLVNLNVGDKVGIDINGNFAVTATENYIGTCVANGFIELNN